VRTCGLRRFVRPFPHWELVIATRHAHSLRTAAALLEQFGDEYLEEQDEVEFLITEEEPRTLAEVIEAEQEFFDKSGTCGASRTRTTSASSPVTFARG
jgi:hypothetical protein